jgi:hypothetical protein
LNSTGVEHFRRYVHCAPDSPRPELDYTITYGNVRLVLANAYDDWASPAMRSWLEGELARARREGPHDFLIVAMHWGLCSCGPHGENRRLRSAGIDDLFRQYGVDLVLAGHDHFYERGDDHGLRYVVTGGGGAPLYTADTARPYTLAYSREHHFLRVDAEGDALTVAAIRTDGTVIDRCALRHTGWDCPPAPAALRPDAGASHIDAGSASTSTPGCSCRAVGSLPRGGAMVAALACAALRRRRRGIARERVAG